MKELEECIRQYIASRVLSNSVIDMEEELAMTISEKIIDSKRKRGKISLVDMTTATDASGTTAFVFIDNEFDSWQFKKFDSVVEAIRYAINNVGAHVIVDGQEVAFDILDDGNAFYVDEQTGKAKLIEIAGNRVGKKQRKRCRAAINI